MKPENKWIEFPSEPLISKTDWDRIQEKTKFNKSKARRTSEDTEKSWLRDNLACGFCGSKMMFKKGSKRKDGSAPRYYTCYWARATKKQLAQHNKDKRCTMPSIPAKQLEAEIWRWMSDVISLRRGNREFLKQRRDNALESLLDLKSIEKQIAKRKQVILNLKKERDKLSNARKRLFDMLESGSFDSDTANEFEQRLNRNQERVQEISDQILREESKIAESKKIEDYSNLLKDFQTSKQDVMEKLLKDIWKLDAKLKKQLVESMTADRIEIIEEMTEPGLYEMGINYRKLKRSASFIDCLKAFENDGKINFLNQYGSKYIKLINWINMVESLPN